MLEDFIQLQLTIIHCFQKNERFFNGSIRQVSFYELTNPATGAEDFSYFSQEIPGVYFWLGVNKPGVGLDSANFGERTDAAGNHSPYFYVDDSALDEGKVNGLTFSS